MHILAYCYNWQPSELWDISIRERKNWVNMVLTQKEQEEKQMHT
jgi:hypothetical protein